MAQTIPKTVKQWTVTSTDGKDGFNSLKFSEEPVPELGDSQVLYISSGCLVKRSDGAGTVIAVGKHVKRFKPGDKVVTLFNQAHIGGPPNGQIIMTGLGGALDGTFRSVGAFDEQGLVHMPSGLTFVEAGTLSCAGVTAWNAPGHWRCQRLCCPVCQSCWREGDCDNELEREGQGFGEVGRGGVGVDHIVEVVGPTSIKQSFDAIKIDGAISIIGFVAGREGEQPGFLENLNHLCTTRGLIVGSRTQMEEMCRAIEAHPDKLRPVVDPKVFSLEQLKEAYEYQWSGKHAGKVCIEIN